MLVTPQPPVQRQVPRMNAAKKTKLLLLGKPKSVHDPLWKQLVVKRLFFSLGLNSLSLREKAGQTSGVGV